MRFVFGSVILFAYQPIKQSKFEIFLIDLFDLNWAYYKEKYREDIS